MQQIADEADVSLGTLYNYFPSKESIVHVWMDLLKEDRGDQVIEMIKQMPDTRARLELLLTIIAQGFVEEKALMAIYFTDRMKRSLDTNSSVRDTVKPSDGWAEILRWGQEQGDIRTDVPIPVLVGHIRIITGMTVMAWLKNPENDSLVDKLKQALDLFLKGASYDQKTSADMERGS